MPSPSATLAQKTCAPCKGGIPPLTSDEAAAYLKQLPQWALRDDGRRIERNYTFEDFVTALAFVNKAGDLAEVEGHHPDISFGWGYATMSLQTHKFNGLHDNDFIMAAKLDAIDATR